MGVQVTSALDAALQIQIFEIQLRMESIPYDVFDLRSGEAVYTTEKTAVAIPEEIYIKLSADAAQARTVSVPLLKALINPPTLGSGNSQVGNEEDITVKQFISHYTDLSHAVAGQEYGILARDKLPYQIFQKITPLLALYFKEYTGRMRREALIQRYAENLRAAPHNLAAQFHPHWNVAGVAIRDFPTFDRTNATFVNSIVTALNSAGAGQRSAVTVRYLQRLEEWASAEIFIEPIVVGGMETYVVLLPSPQARWLKDPRQAGQLGELFVQKSGLNDYDLKFPGVIGRVGRLLILEDNRYPTLTLGGSSGNFSLTPQYRGQGRGTGSDTRDKSSTGRQVGFLLGRMALCEWRPEDWHYEWEYEQYDKIYGKGLFTSIGIERVDFDLGTNPTNATKQHDGSALLVFAPPPVVF